jgi:hypothetical protein
MELDESGVGVVGAVVRGAGRGVAACANDTLVAGEPGLENDGVGGRPPAPAAHLVAVHLERVLGIRTMTPATVNRTTYKRTLARPGAHHLPEMNDHIKKSLRVSGDIVWIYTLQSGIVWG